MSNFDSQHTESTLFIDVGNSSIKVGFKREGKWTVHSFENAKKAAFDINNYPYPLKRIILASVRQDITDTLEREIESHLIHELRISQVKKEELDYETPDTLGIDRYLVCLGAKEITENPVVVVDAGSACTIDYMDEGGVYKGGVIMPGLNSLVSIFKRTAPELPAIEVAFPKNFPGKSTEESLQLGQVIFFADGINMMLDRFSNIYGEYDLYLTGGDAQTVSKLIRNSGTIDESLIFDGMASMLSKTGH